MTEDDNTDLYAVLGVHKTASRNEVKKRFQTLALKNHPDKIDKDEPRQDPDEFCKIAEAWKILGDDTSRKEYDAKLMAQNLSNIVPVGEEISLEDMTRSEDHDSYYSLCHCGGQYILMNDDISTGLIAVNCDTCSLSILVHCSEQTNTSRGS